MKKYTLYLGLNDKDTKVQKINTLEAYKICMNLLSKFTDGATIYSAKGYYKHEIGAVVFENSLRIELMFIEISEVLKIIDTLKILFNQESIVLQVENIQSELI